MTKYLCEKCRHRKGKLRTYHRVDSAGVERNYTNAVMVCCTASEKHPNMVKDAKADVAYYEPWQVCPDFKGRAK